jgi:hypothetical protein
MVAKGWTLLQGDEVGFFVVEAGLLPGASWPIDTALRRHQ